MATNFKVLNPDYDSEDPNSTQYIDMDDRFINDAWIMERFAGNQLWTWGNNGGNSFSGALGVGDRTHRSSPTQVGSLTNWKQVAGGAEYTAAIKVDGTLWTWGRNDTNGPLGQNNLTLYSSPVQVGSLTNWKQVDGNLHTAAVKTDGTLWAWGPNSGGCLGQNNTTSYSSPVQVGTSSVWKQVACGRNMTAAISTNGNLFTWGSNNTAYGNLGLNNTNDYSQPAAVGSLTDWKQVSSKQYHVAAVKTDGTLWIWGKNDNGELGQNNRTHRSSPVQVGSLTNWKMVACGNDHTMAIKTDGTLWAWGGNDYGQLGLSIYSGFGYRYSSPVQVGALTTWKQVSCGTYQTLAVKTDGTLWSWGKNGNGELGQGDINHRSSPIQVGSLTNWKMVGAGYYHSAGITYTEIS